MPKENENLRGGTLGYTVTITNYTTFSPDTFTLDADDDWGWTLSISSSVMVPALSSENVTLTVTIPNDAPYDNVYDNIWVTATSQADSDYDNIDNCGARAVRPTRDPGVSISPEEDTADSGSIVTFTVTITNYTAFQDNYVLEAVDDFGWTSIPNEVTVLGNDFKNVDLTVTIPMDADDNIWDYIEVTATSRADSDYDNSDNCRVNVIVGWGVKVSISPENQGGWAGEALEYTVTVTNQSGINADNYTLHGKWIFGFPEWPLNISPNELSLPAKASGSATLTVSIPDNAQLGTIDNIRVEATSTSDKTGWDWCIAHVVPVSGVSVSVSPSEDNAALVETLVFTVTVKNTGTVSDNYDLAIEDNAGWGPTLDDNIFRDVARGESETTTLRVTIPAYTPNYTRDEITVTATSQADNNVSGSDSCVVQALIVTTYRVSVSISPSSQDDILGGTLEYTVTIMNKGNVTDDYDLAVVDDAGWGATLDDNLSTVLARGAATVTLRVTVPSDAVEGESTMITVTATSRGNPTKSGSASCTTTATTPPPPPYDILPIAVGGVVVVAVGGAGAAIAVLIKEGLIHFHFTARFMRPPTRRSAATDVSIVPPGSDHVHKFKR